MIYDRYNVPEWIVSRMDSEGWCDCDDEECSTAWDERVQEIMFEVAP